MDLKEEIAVVKRSFYTYRNGVVADVMRKGGSPFRVIFGLTLPQVDCIARDLGMNAELSRALWNDYDVRESMMLAPMLMDVSAFTLNDVLEWTASLRAIETADVLALKLLRRMDCLADVVEALCGPERTPMQRYTGFRAAFGLLASHPQLVRRLAEDELSSGEPAAVAVARQLLEAVIVRE